MNKVAIFIRILILLTLSACTLAPVSRNWSSATSEKPAVLMGDTAISIISMDGDKKRHCYGQIPGLFATFQTCDITLDSGHHSLVVRFLVGNQSTDDIPLAFDAVSGHMYQVKWEHVHVNWHQGAVRPSVVDVTSSVASSALQPTVQPLTRPSGG
jgi:hypothetical protein